MLNTRKDRQRTKSIKRNTKNQRISPKHNKERDYRRNNNHQKVIPIRNEKDNQHKQYNRFHHQILWPRIDNIC